jgi:hypothetical protein
MKKAGLILIANLFLATGIMAQDSLGVYVSGMMSNLMGIAVEIDLECSDGQTATVTVNPNGYFNYFFDGCFGNVTATFVNCEGDVVVTEGSYEPFFQSASFNLNYCDNGSGDIYGCTDYLANNWNPQANVDDGSCTYDEPFECENVTAELYVCTFSNGFEVGLEILDDEGTAVYSQFGYNDLEILFIPLCLEDGICYSVEMSNSANTGWYGGYWWISVNGVQVATGALDENLDFELGNISVDDTCPSLGCTDPDAWNYDSGADIDNGSCFYLEDCECDSIYAPVCAWIYPAGGNNGEEVTFDNECLALCAGAFTFYDGECGNPVIYGCTDSEALNYNSSATDDDGSCDYAEPCDNNSVIASMDLGTFGSETTWTVTDDGGNVVGSGGPYNGNITYPTQLCLEDGCYNLNMYDSFGDGWNGSILTLSVDGETVAVGDLPIGSYGSIVFGLNSDDCVDTNVYGCTDPLALNYNPLATVNDGSCTYDNGGGDSTDCAAYFIAFADSLGANTIWAINLSTGDNLSYLWDFGDGSTSSDQYPQYTYDGDGPYDLCLTVLSASNGAIQCEDTFCMTISADMFPGANGGNGNEAAQSVGFQLNVIADIADSVTELSTVSGLKAYPNPTSGELQIECALHQSGLVNLTLYGLDGKIVTSETRALSSGTNRLSLDLGNLQSGVYTLSLQVGQTTLQQLVVKL